MILNRNFIILCFLFFLMFLVFQFNILRTARHSKFLNFQIDSEALVLGAMLEGNYTKTNGLGLGAPRLNDKGWFEDIHHDFVKGIRREDYRPYTSQIGLQGYFFSFLYKILAIKNLNFYQSINSLLLTASILFFFIVLYTQIGKVPALFFYLSVITSNWVIFIGRNLYWVSWTWILPTIVTTIFVTGRYPKWLILTSYGFAIGLKLACGYEYATSVVLMSFIPFVYMGIKDQKSGRKVLVQMIVFGFISLIAFLFISSLHATLRANTFHEGVEAIFSDVTRRTQGDLAKDSSIIEVLGLYIFGFGAQISENIRLGIILILTFCIGAAYLVLNASKSYKAIGACYLFSLLPPISWFIAAKSHSYLHTHLNYVLWYFPTIPLGFTVLACAIILWRGRT